MLGWVVEGDMESGPLDVDFAVKIKDVFLSNSHKISRVNNLLSGPLSKYLGLKLWLLKVLAISSATNI